MTESLPSRLTRRLAPQYPSIQVLSYKHVVMVSSVAPWRLLPAVYARYYIGVHVSL